MVRGAYSINTDTTPILGQIITLGNLYLTHEIDFSSISLKSDLGSVALVSACSKKLINLFYTFSNIQSWRTVRSPEQSAHRRT